MHRSLWIGLLLLIFLLLSPVAGMTVELAENGKPVVYFGVIPRYNPMVMYRNYQPIMDYLTEHTSYHFELKLSRNYTEAVDFLRTTAETKTAVLLNAINRTLCSVYLHSSVS